LFAWEVENVDCMRKNAQDWAAV